MRSIYLDYGSTTPVAASVRDKMLPFLSEFYGHPSSCHWFGRAAHEAIEDARSTVATLIGCHPSELIFTSGGTESVNLGLLGAARSIARNEPELRPHIIISTMEHACVRRCAEQLEREGWSVTLVGCDSDGVVKLEEIDHNIREETRLVSILHASHRIGTVQPIDKISDLCRDTEILVHTDAAQSVGKIPCDVEGLGVDLLSFSAHKMYGPKGVGGLYSRLGVALDPIQYGEPGEAGLRPGTSDVAAIVGLGQAAKLANLGLTNSIDRVSQMRDKFIAQLREQLGVPIKVHGEKAERVPGLISLELPSVTAEAMQQRIPEICFGPAQRTGDTGSMQPLQSFGPTEHQSPHTLRLAIGWSTSEDEVHQAIQLITDAYHSLAS
ncbi:MAG: cysteine desulfurase family protein [Aureliella sp.]